MFGRSKRRAAGGGGDAGPLKGLEDRLVELAPGLVREMRAREPAYCLRVWYFEGGRDGGRPPSLMLCPDARRRRALAERTGDLIPYYLWCADEMFGGAGNADVDDPGVADLLRGWYAGRGGDVAGVRRAVQRAAARLNRVEWAGYAPVTDDFVVFAADGSHEFCDDRGEMLASVPVEKVALLRDRGMLWPI